jgi:hypothetical protein
MYPSFRGHSSGLRDNIFPGSLAAQTASATAHSLLGQGLSDRPDDLTGSKQENIKSQAQFYNFPALLRRKINSYNHRYIVDGSMHPLVRQSEALARPLAILPHME